MAGMPVFKQLKRLAFRAETTGRVKDLAGFVKGHTVPERSSIAASRFLARIAADDLQADMDETYQALRESFGLKRKQIEASLAEGAAVIHTPRFTYSIKVDADPAKPTNVIWQREVSGMRDPLIVRSPEFQAVFGTLFNSLVFEFTKPVNVAKLIDQFEDDERPGRKIVCGSDGSWCEISLVGYLGTIRVDAASLLISGRAASSTASLLDQFLAFIEHLPRQHKWPALR